MLWMPSWSSLSITPLSSSGTLASPSVMQLMQHPGTNEVIVAVIERFRLEHLNHVMADIEVGWKCSILSAEEEEEEEERAWKMMKSYARVWRWC